MPIPDSDYVSQVWKDGIFSESQPFIHIRSFHVLG